MNNAEETIIKDYFAAWDAHDAAAALALFKADGSYHDSATQKPLRGSAIADYARSLFAAFPDISFEMLAISQTSAGVFAVPWVLFGHHQGELMGYPASGKKAVLPGCDFIRLSDGKIASVRGFFDVQDLLAQLGLS